MPYTDWLETRRNIYPDPRFNTGNIVALYSSSTKAVSGDVLTVTRGTANGGLAAMLYSIPHGANLPASARVQVRRKPGTPDGRMLDVNLASYAGGSGLAWGTNGSGTVRITLTDDWQDVALTGYISQSTATAMGVQFVCQYTWDIGDGFEVRWPVVEAAMTVGDPFNGDDTDTDTVRYFWAGAVNNSASVEEQRVFEYPPAPRGSETIRPQDLLVEYRDRNLVRQGSIPIEDLQLKIQPVFNGVGSWSVTLPAEHRAVPYLRAPGAGIIVTNLLTGETLLSGSTSKPSKKATSADPKGMATIAGLSDDRLLWDALAFPQPSNANPATQTAANDVRTAKASTLMRLYVNANIGPGSPVGRRGSSLRNKLTLGPDALLGAVTTRRPRFDVLGDLLNGIALETGLGFRVVQVGSNLQFQVYQPTNRAASIRLDVHNGTLQEQTVETAPPEVTRVVVAGQGQGTERQIFQFDTTDSLQGEDDWGFIIEEFKDQRNTSDTAELESSAMERLNEAGFTKIAVKATPSNEDTMIFMTDFFLGDQVAVVIDGQEQPNSIITEAAIVVDNTGLHTAVAIGDVYDFDSSSALRQTVEDTQKRLDNLERNVEIGSIGWDDVQGKPTTYPPSMHGHVLGDLGISNLGNSVDLNTLAQGLYHQSANAQAATGTNYPAALAGLLEVYVNGGMSYQRYTLYNGTGHYERSRYQTTWYPWRFITDSTPWSSVTGKPSAFTPTPHTHSADDITSGILNISRIPNIANNPSNGRTYLGTNPSNPISGDSNYLAIAPDSDTTVAPFRFVRNNSTQVLVIENDGEITGNAKMDAARLTKGTVPEARFPTRIQGNAPSLGSTDLNTVKESGWYVQHTSSNIVDGMNYPVKRAGLLEVVFSTSGNDFGLQRYTDYQHSSDGSTGIGKLEWVRNYYNGTWYPWTPAAPAANLPLPWLGNGGSAMSISSTGWAGIPGDTRLELPAYDRDMLVDVVFGAEGSCSSGYWMIGASIFNQTGSPTWSISPENPDPRISSSLSAYGLYAPFAQGSGEQTHAYGSKSVVIPAGVASVFQLAMRKSASVNAVLNYASIEVKPQRWL